MEGDQSLQNSHAKLLASEVLSSSCSFSRAEAVGIVVSVDLKPDKFLNFLIDDGTGCVPCILWLNHHSSPYFSRRCPLDVGTIGESALRSARAVAVGSLARVRGRITSYRGNTQITVSDVVIEIDPNAPVLHWLDCIRLARRRYGLVGPTRR